MATALLSLPQELKVKILSYLDAVSLARCKLTCRCVRESIRDYSALQYIFQLHFEGLKDTGACSIDIHRRIEQLQRRRKTWSSLKVTERYVVDVPFRSRIELVGGFISFLDSFGRFSLKPLIPSPVIKQDKVVGGEVVNGVEFAIDPTQDLLAILVRVILPNNERSFEIHLKTISTNSPHPRAVKDRLIFDDFWELKSGEVRMQLSGSTLALFVFPHSKAYVSVWDWPTSEVILVSQIPREDPFYAAPWSRSRQNTTTTFTHLIPPLPTNFNFQLLSPTYCLVIVTDKEDPHIGDIRLYHLGRTANTANAPTASHLATFYLPSLTSQSHLVDISLDIRCPSIPLDAPLLDSCFGTARPLHTINAEEQIHSFTMLYHHYPAEGDISQNYMDMFVHQRAFMKYCVPGDVIPGAAKHIQWDEWGPYNAMIICPAKPFFMRHHIRSVHGQRIIYPWNGDDLLDVGILDFTIGAVMVAEGLSNLPSELESSMPDKGRGTLMSSTSLTTSEYPFFEREVETHLRCVAFSLDLHENTNAIVHTYSLCENGVVCAADRGTATFKLHVFTLD
ncbi:hypothetical protein BDN70DRAFT_997103 [Pholiota conissans]|uniref:F-box domain-containing protein n=1 Tax=Pholiota conissans TaxID=109636 RepID=A0A9P5YTC9_9AGAR|nr:hypothetical protein BDN70DRAFT_997103 [Pholiota conissans]